MDAEPTLRPAATRCYNFNKTSGYVTSVDRWSGAFQGERKVRLF